jgi:hypothetical protein
MGLGGKEIRRAAKACALVICALAILPSTAFCAEYPRRIAIAPFVSLAKEDIQQTVSVLPRLLSSRLMALSGADVTLLPSGEKSSVDLAKSSGIPLLAQGTVAKLGKGFSIDVVVSDLQSGKSAGAFFASANTEDDIIPQLGVLAGDISEKLFGVKSAARVAPPAPAPAAAPPAAQPPVLPAAGPSAASAAAPVPSVPIASSGPWEPRTIVKVTASDKIADELFRVSMGDLDGDGDPEIVATGRRTIYFYKVRGDAILPFPPIRIARGLEHHFLNVEIFDADGDGKPEIFVTDLVNDRLRSFVLQYRDGTFATTASDIPYFIVLLSDLEGKKTLAGQSTGLDQIFQGNLQLLNYSKGKMTDGRTVKLPLDDGIFGLNAIPIGKEGKFVYIDVDEHLRVWDGKGKTLSKTKEYFSGARDEVTRGTTTRATTGPANTFIRGRVIPMGGETENPFLLVRQAEGSTIVRNLRMFKNSRLVIGKYDGGSFSVRTASETMENLITDAVPHEDKGGRGAIVAATVLEETSSAVSSPVSRLFLYRVQ